MSPTELPQFYEDLVQKLRERGVVCAITSGLACVHYGIAETTQDCDLLCAPASFQALLNFLATTRVGGVACQYRGNISPPLDVRWHGGGWTSHFEWPVAPNPVFLDVFGHALRESSPWTRDLLGLYANPNTVAEMKRTNRDKDWAFVTALGVRMVEAGDNRGWLHVFSTETLFELVEREACPAELAAKRPALALAIARDPQTAGALNAERKFWEELDRRRIRLLERCLRPYVSAVRKARHGLQPELMADHDLRLTSATRHLPMNPLRDYGTRTFIDETRAVLVDSGLIPRDALTWLPDVGIYFDWLNK